MTKTSPGKRRRDILEGFRREIRIVTNPLSVENAFGRPKVHFAPHSPAACATFSPSFSPTISFETAQLHLVTGKSEKPSTSQIYLESRMDACLMFCSADVMNLSYFYNLQSRCKSTSSTLVCNVCHFGQQNFVSFPIITQIDSERF